MSSESDLTFIFEIEKQMPIISTPAEKLGLRALQVDAARRILADYNFVYNLSRSSAPGYMFVTRRANLSDEEAALLLDAGVKEKIKVQFTPHIQDRIQAARSFMPVPD